MLHGEGLHIFNIQSHICPFTASAAHTTTFSQQQQPPILATPLYPTNGGDFTSKIHQTLSHSLLRLSTQLPPRGHTHSHICPDAAPAVRPITFRWQQRLPVLTAPTNGVDFTGGEVTPKVLRAILLITLIAQPEQRPTGDDDGGHPVGTRGGLVGHLHPHPFDKAALQAALHLPSTTHTTSATANWAPMKSKVFFTSQKDSVGISMWCDSVLKGAVRSCK